MHASPPPTNYRATGPRQAARPKFLGSYAYDIHGDKMEKIIM